MKSGQRSVMASPQPIGDSILSIAGLLVVSPRPLYWTRNSICRTIPPTHWLWFFILPWLKKKCPTQSSFSTQNIPSFIIQLFVHSYIQSTSIHWASSMCPCTTVSPTVVETDICTIIESEYWLTGAQRGSHQCCLGTWRISGDILWDGSLGREGGQGHTCRRTMHARTRRCERWSVSEAFTKSINGKSVHICTCAHPNFWSMFSFILFCLVVRKRQGKSLGEGSWDETLTKKGHKWYEFNIRGHILSL